MKSDKTKDETPRPTFGTLLIGACEYGGYAVYRYRTPTTNEISGPAYSIVGARPLYAGKLNKCLSFIANHIERRPEEPDCSDFIENMRRVQAGRPEGEPT